MDFLARLVSGNFGETPSRHKAHESLCRKKAEKPMRLNASAKGTIKAKANITVKPILGIARVKKINANKYLIYSANSRENIKMIAKRLMAFNDMEIAYSEDLEGNELINSTEKPLWAISKAETGELVLERVA